MANKDSNITTMKKNKETIKKVSAKVVGTDGPRSYLVNTAVTEPTA